MILIGPHTDVPKYPPRFGARAVGWGCFQSHFGNPHSFNVPGWYESGKDNYDPIDRTCEEKWFWHASFVASANPGDRSREICAHYLTQVCKHARKYRIDGIVIHTGKVVGIPVEIVESGMVKFLKDYRLLDAARESGTVLAVEMGASTCGFNLNPIRFAQLTNGVAGLGWCLDTAHCHAAGTPWRDVREAIEINPPTVAHINFPGSNFGSSQDIHGWRCHPNMVQHKKEKGSRNTDVAALICEEFDLTIRQLHAAGVPMIVEGSGFPFCDVHQDIVLIKRILNGYQP